MLTGLLFGDAAESIFPVEKLYNLQCFGENETLRRSNPTKGEVNIQLPSTGNWQITATDIEGRVVWQQECKGCVGIVRHNLNSAKGLYFIKIINTTTGQQSVKKITLQ